MTFGNRGRSMKIKYVVSSMVFWGCENNLTFEQDCEFLRSLGFGIELWPNEGGLNACKYDRRNWKRLSHATKDMLVSMRSRNDNPTLEQWQEQIQWRRDAQLANRHRPAKLRHPRRRRPERQRPPEADCRNGGAK